MLIIGVTFHSLLSFGSPHPARPKEDDLFQAASAVLLGALSQLNAERLTGLSSWDDLEHPPSVDPIDAKVAVERENPVQSQRFGERNQGGIGKIHRNIPILLHEVMDPRQTL